MIIKKAITSLIVILVIFQNAISQISFQPAINNEIINYPYSIIKVDLNIDGIQDLITANLANNNVTTFLGDGLGSFFFDSNYIVGSNPAVSPYFISSGDFNNDGLLDIVTAMASSDSISLRLLEPGGHFGTQNVIRVGEQPTSIALSDFNNDNKLDIVTTNFNSGKISLLLGHGNGLFNPPIFFDAGINPRSVTKGNFNSDKNMDLAVCNSGSNNISIFLGDGTGHFSSTTSLSTGQFPNTIITNDFNSDGNLDLATSNSGSGNLTIFFGNGNGNFPDSNSFTTGPTPYSIISDDINGDYNVDLIIPDFTSNKIAIHLGSSTGHFGLPYFFDTDERPTAVVCGDFNGDNLKDLAFTHKLTIGVLLNNTYLTTQYYKFNGVGDWNNAANWSNNAVPPLIQSPGTEIIIAGNCTLTSLVTISPGVSLKIANGATLLVPGNLIIHKTDK